jgi:hypothetical protein
MIIRSLFCAGLLLGTSLAARADTALYLDLSTLGGGLGLGVELGPTLTLRGGFNALSYDETIEETDVRYDADLDLQSGRLLLDWHPGGAPFRLVAGLLLNGNELGGRGVPTDGSFEINGNEYSADEIGSLDARLDFDTLAPYVGFGFGRAVPQDGRWAWSMDIGIAWQGSADVAVNAQCGAAVPASLCEQIQADVDAEVRELEQDLDDYELWPVLGVSLSYRF